MVSAYDFFPTLMDLLGIKLMQSKICQEEALQILLGESRDSDDSSIVVFDEYGPVRMMPRHLNIYTVTPMVPMSFMIL